MVVAREGRKQIDRIELDLLAATKTDEVVAFVVPGHGGPDFDLALEYVRWVVAELTERGIKVAVHYRAVENGVVLALEDVTGAEEDSMTTATHRQRLAQIRERTHEARAERAKARQLLDAARADHDTDGEAVALVAYDRSDEALQVAERLESQLLSSLAGVDGRGFGGGIFDDPQTIETLQRLGDSSFPIGSIDLGPLGTHEELIETIDAGSWGPSKLAAGTDVVVPDTARVGTYYGVVPQPRRPLSVLDLLPTSPMDSRSFGYLQESGSWVGAAETAEGAVKPEAAIASPRPRSWPPRSLSAR